MNKTYAILALAISIAVALSVFSSIGTSMVLADDNEGMDAGRGHINSAFHDHFNFDIANVEQDSATFISSTQTTSNGITTRTFFGVFASVDDAPTLAVALLNATISKGTDGRSMNFTWAVGGIKLLSIFEYNDTAGTGLYNRSVDGKPLSQIDFEDLEWTLTAKPVSLGGVQGYLVNMTGTKGSFVFEMSAVVYNTGVVVAGTKLAPTEVKVNFTIQNYPFVSNTSRLGLLVMYGGQQHFGTIASMITKNVSESNGEEVESVSKQTTATITKGAFAYFYWNTNAIVDGKTVAVKSEQLSNGTFARIILNYPHGTSILHDPILGAGTGLPSQIPTAGGALGTSAMSLDIYLLIGAAALITLVSALALAVRRRMIEPRLLM